ncbi:MAG: DNA sulfur modification protein DndD [Dyella sp.]|uniref:DNA sulfur modification protein DndD n=1 Tax=Dyella sp. TaxID=1869338 RepID=UPI003F7E8B94
MTESLEFTALEVENIFAYDGVSRIDLSGCTDDQNVIVVSGRNGAGKTSLLNAIKLLFVGTDDAELRRVGYGGTLLAPKPYVIGQTGRWYGVFNTAWTQVGDLARVRLEASRAGEPVKIERRFIRTSDGYRETLEVRVGTGGAMSEDEANTFIGKLAPREIVPFYFFDGEQVQSFADAEEGRERAEIERLLGLSFLPELIKELERFGKEKRRAGLPEEVRKLVVDAENALQDALARINAFQRLREEYENELMDFDRQRARIDTQRDSLRIGISENDRRRMVRHIEILSTKRDRLSSEIAELLPPEAPWLVNLGLVQKAFGALEAHLAHKTDVSVAAALHRDLPVSLRARLSDLTPPVELSDAQQADFAKAIRECLTESGVAPDRHANPLLESLSGKQLASLRERFLRWSQQGSALAGEHARLLLEIRQTTSEHAKAQQELDDAELTTDYAKAKFEELTSELSSIEKEIILRRDLIADKRKDEERAAQEAEQAKAKISENERAHIDAMRDDAAFQVGKSAKRALERYMELRRQQIRKSVEQRLNSHVGVLLGPTQLIQSVTLSDNFVMKYYDVNGVEVARRSISAGMRQLVAMSMLWALKDESGRELPVVIDTPLGRIDRDNRSQLLNQYFPNAGKPLIVLPTDSEMGTEVLAGLGARVRRRYEIQNDGGTRARIVPAIDEFSGRTAKR